MSLKADLAQLEQFWRLVEKVPQIGLDYDFKDRQKIEDLAVIASRFGQVTLRETKKGWHFKIKLPEPVTIKRSFEIRYFMQDDYHRLCRDMLKAMNGARTIDVLFDLKTIKRKTIFE